MDNVFMEIAKSESRKCIDTETAYNVGCVIVADGEVIATGFSRELPGNTHAEENAINKIINTICVMPVNSILYTTMEPCSVRLSGKKCCCDIILDHPNIIKVVIYEKEPDKFVVCKGVQILSDAGIDVCLW